MKLIEQGALQEGGMPELALRLGISDRYLRGLFQKNIGVSPKKYALYQQSLFAKKLLQDTALPITQVAFAAGFNSVRRFNEVIQDHLNLSPRQIRKKQPSLSGRVSLKLSYRPPYAWTNILQFLQTRMLEEVEWVEQGRYCRTIEVDGVQGWFSVANLKTENALQVNLYLSSYKNLNLVVKRIRDIFDLDASTNHIEEAVYSAVGHSLEIQPGLRVPGVWGFFETGVRAILGQQVRVSSAIKLVNTLTEYLGEAGQFTNIGSRRLFPTPCRVLDSDLDFLKIPNTRKKTLRAFATHVLEDPCSTDISSLFGIGPWTENYIRLRYEKDPDIWLAGDAGIKNVLKQINVPIDSSLAKPWRSYLTFHVWNNS